MDIIKRINDLRAERGWSVNYLAMEAELTQSTLATMLSRNTPPKLDTLQSLCNAFGITMAQFFNDGGDSEILSADEKELLREFRKFSEEKKKALIEFLKTSE